MKLINFFKDNSIVFHGICYTIFSLILMYVIFAAVILGLIFFGLWNIGISPTLEIPKIDILASGLATLSIFSIFNFSHIDILKNNKRRKGTLRYNRYNLWLNIGLKVFIYLFASTPFLILWNYAIPHIFAVNLAKINLLQAILFIMAIRFIFGMIFYSVSKNVTSNTVTNNIAEILINWLNDIYPEGTYCLFNKDLDEKTGYKDFVEQFCKENHYTYRLGSISTEFVAICCPKNEKNKLKQVNAVVFKDKTSENEDWFKFYDLTDDEIKDLDIIEFNIYECGYLNTI